MSMLTISGEGRQIHNPTDDYKGMIHRVFPRLPYHTNTERAATPVVTIQQVRWVMDPNLSIFLLGFESRQPVAFDFILTLVTQYISNNRDRLLHPLNLEIACIRQDGLFNIFGCSYIHKSQIKGVLRDHISPVVD